MAVARHLRRVAERLPQSAEQLQPATDASDAVVLHLWQATQIVIDLATQTVATADGTFVREFSIDPFVKHCLLNGLDDIGLTMQHEDEIAAYEARRESRLPVTSAN